MTQNKLIEELKLLSKDCEKCKHIDVGINCFPCTHCIWNILSLKVDKFEEIK